MIQAYSKQASIGRKILCASVLYFASTLSVQAFTITQLSDTNVTRSGFFSINGTELGAAGDLTVGGTPALIANWTNTQILAYTAENTPLGTGEISINGLTTGYSLEISERTAVQRLQWQFRYIGNATSRQPVIAPDNNIYASDATGFVYALTPNGGLRWVKLAGNHGIDISQDGSVIYTVDHRNVTAISANGEILWQFDLLPYLTYRIGDLKVGPDGNIYIGSPGDLGMFALSPQGQLLWSSPIPVNVAQNDYTRIAFGSRNGETQVYFNSGASLHAYDLKGNALFTTYAGNPVIAPNGNLYLGPYVVSPTGSLVCMVDDGWSEPAVTSSNVRFGTRVDLVVHDAGCKETRRYIIPQYAITAPALYNNEKNILLSSSNSGDSITYALDTSNGQETWRQNYPVMNGLNQQIRSSPVVRSDNSIAYINTGVVGDTTLRGFLSALTLNSSAPGEVNQNPVAENQNVVMSQDSSTGIMLTATDPDGDVLSFFVVNNGAPYSGTLSGTPPDLTYTPASGYFGTDQFQFYVTDNQGGISSSATVSILVSKTNLPPIATDDSATLDQGDSIELNVTVNDSDPENDAFQINSASSDDGVSVRITSPTTLKLRARKNFLGNTNAYYNLIDSAGKVSNTATVSVNVTAPATSPKGKK